MIYLIPFSFVISFIICFVLLRYSHLLNIVDIPNHRSMHETPTPRSGGIGFMFASFISLSLMINQAPIVLAITALALAVFLLSLLDDMISLSAILRLCGHLAVCTTFIYLMQSYHLISYGLLTSFLLVILGAWLINLFNFMDGLDGLCVLTALMGFIALGIFAAIHKEPYFCISSFIICASLIGFSFFNWPKAFMFMGDCGSATLGFLVFSFVLWGVNRNLFNLFEGVTLFAPFIFDSTLTLFKRALKKEKVWQAHSSHYYQRLKKEGKATTWVLMLYGALMLFSFLSVTLSEFFDVKTAILYPYGLFAALAFCFDKK